MSNGIASSTAYGRSAHVGIGKGYPTAATPLTPGPAFLSLDEPENSSSQPGGEYAYSTTLRRQQSSDHFHVLGRSSSPHASSSSQAISPFGRRTGSGSENQGDNPYAYRGRSGGDESSRGRSGSSDVGMVEKVMRAGKRLIGAQNEYEEVIDLNERASSRGVSERRDTETPSTIYAHRSVDVSGTRS